MGSSISAWPAMRLRPFFGGAASRFSWATLPRTRDARVVIKREKVPKGFRPVRDRSQEVSRWVGGEQQTKNEWLRLLTAPTGTEQTSNHTTLRRASYHLPKSETDAPSRFKQRPRGEFATLICGITMSDTSFGITYGRKD
jgi:hypothetical protein